MADKYAVNYEDERFKALENERDSQITKTNTTYDQMINNSEQFYQKQIDASKAYADEQSKIQQQNTDFAIEKINQQKEQANKNYIKEQKASYLDYQKQIDPYSVDAEKMAANGLQNSGYAESSRVRMWNTYQNRYATARESYNNAILNYDNGIKEATLANSSALAQIAYQSLQQQLELGLQGFQYKNSLIRQKETELKYANERYDTKYQNVLAQINKELDTQRELDQWYEEFKQRQAEQDRAHEQWKKEFDMKKEQYAIQNALAEKEYQLAVQKERRTSEQYGDYVVDDNPNKLSDEAKKLLEKYNSALKNSENKGIVGKASKLALETLYNKNNMAKIIASKYPNKISENDVRILCSKLGI